MREAPQRHDDELSAREGTPNPPLPLALQWTQMRIFSGAWVNGQGERVRGTLSRRCRNLHKPALGRLRRRDEMVIPHRYSRLGLLSLCLGNETSCTQLLPPCLWGRSAYVCLCVVRCGMPVSKTHDTSESHFAYSSSPSSCPFPRHGPSHPCPMLLILPNVGAPPRGRPRLASLRASRSRAAQLFSFLLVHCALDNELVPSQRILRNISPPCWGAPDPVRPLFPLSSVPPRAWWGLPPVDAEIRGRVGVSV